MLARQLPAPPDSARFWSEASNIFSSLYGAAPPADLEPAPPREGEETWTLPPPPWWSSGDAGGLEPIRLAAVNHTPIILPSSGTGRLVAAHSLGVTADCNFLFHAIRADDGEPCDAGPTASDQSWPVTRRTGRLQHGRQSSFQRRDL